jgi:pimeloyl-ACP methyl ester carboxylesterase
MSQTPVKIEPFKVDIPDSVLEDLYARLRNTRWAPDLDNEDMYYGVSTEYMRGLVDYWLTEFDWRAAEAEINQFAQFRTVIDDQPVHFIHEKGKGADPLPLIVSHGWPWTFWDMRRIIGPLTDPAAHGGNPADSFDVIVPSLAGWGFSTPARGDMNYWKMADIFHTLMTEGLGHERYAASGGDYGSLVAGQLAHKYAQDLAGIHLTMDVPLDLFAGDEFWSIGSIPPGLDDGLKQEFVNFFTTYFAHVAVHMLDGQPLILGLNDSPVGMLAWILERWRKWSDKNVDFTETWSRDHILTNATIYWVSESIGSSIRGYRNAVRYPWKPVHDRSPVMEAPTGFTFLAGDAYPPGATTETRVAAFENGPTGHMYNTVYTNVHAKGGHFAHFENPAAVVHDIRAHFRALR